MKELVEEIIEWQEATFSRATVEAVREKLSEETYELADAIHWNAGPEFIADEIADVIIVAARWCKMNGMDLETVVRNKMAINRGREFGPEMENGDRKRVK